MSTCNLLEDQIVGSYERSEFPPGWAQHYVPEGCLERLITKDSIIREFTRDDESGGEKQVDEDLLDFILRSAQKLLAVSLLTGFNTSDLHRAMKIFKSSGFSDTKLPIKYTDRLESPWSELQWSAVKLGDFRNHQWKFLVPIFREDEIKLELESLHILPFTLATRDTKQGTFGDVWEVKIHESHLEKPMRKFDGSRANAAIKEIKEIAGLSEKEARKEWQKEERALVDAIGLKHTHIIEVKAIITWTGKGKYFMFQWADGGNLRDFYRRVPRPNLSGTLMKEIVRQLMGLADALNTLHNYKKHDKDAGSYRHGNLKPENILRFEDGTETGSLKISDMGLAKPYFDETGLRGPTTTRYGTPLYEPPEVILESKEARPRRYDMWSMGCIILELIVWLLYGNDELEKFNDCLHDSFEANSPYWALNNDRAQVHPSVQTCIELIGKDPECVGSTAIGDLLNVVRTRLLVVPLPPRTVSLRQQIAARASTGSTASSSGQVRAKAEEFYSALKQIMDKGGSNDKYWFTGRPRHNVIGPVNSILSSNLVPLFGDKTAPTVQRQQGGLRARFRQDYVKLFGSPSLKKFDNSNALEFVLENTRIPRINTDSDIYQPTIVPEQSSNYASIPMISDDQTQPTTISDGHSQSTFVTNNQTRSTSVSDSQTQSMSFRSQGTEQTKTSMTSVEMIAEEESRDCGPTVDDDGDVYSEDGSIANYRDIYTRTLKNELQQDIRKFADVVVLSRRLKEFAIMLGHQGQRMDRQGDRMLHNRMMFIAHRHGRNIAQDICQIQQKSDRGSTTDDSSESDTSNSTPNGNNARKAHDAEPVEPVDIEQWMTESREGGAEPVPEVIETTDTVYPEAQISNGADLLRNSEAYRWLVTTIKRDYELRGVEPICMRDHRKTLLSFLETSTGISNTKIKISRRRPPPLYTVKFHLKWDLSLFLREQEYPNDTLSGIVGRVITISGDSHCVQALPCHAYMAQTWPRMGAEFLRYLDELVRAYGETHICTLPDNTRISACLLNGSAFFEATGTKYGLAEVTEMLLWVSTAMQTPKKAPGISLSSADITGEFHIGEAPVGPNTADLQTERHVGTAYVYATYKTRSTDQATPFLESQGQCWHDLFRFCTIVEGYPIPSRPSKQPGLEIPLDMLASLTRAERITLYDDNLIMKGFSTLLYAAKFLEDCVFWHLIYNEDGSRVSFADERIPLSDAASKLDLEAAYKSARHIVGWSAKVETRTGAVDANYNIDYSRLKAPSPGFALSQVTITAGIPYAPIGAAFVRGVAEKPVHIKEESYRLELEDIGERFVVLFDVEDRRGWLVDGLSALYHLIRYRLNYQASRKDFSQGNLSKPEDLKPVGGNSPRDIAFNTLRDPDNMRVRLHWNDAANTQKISDTEDDSNYYCVKDCVKGFVDRLEKILDSHESKRGGDRSIVENINAAHWSRLEGFDFKEIARLPKSIYPVAATLLSEGGGDAWVPLTRAIHAAVLFGSGFGELLRPDIESKDDNHCASCHWNQSVPRGRDLLAVSVADLERIVERGAKHETRWQLRDNLFLDWNPARIFSMCSGDTKLYCQERFQRVYPESTMKKLKQKISLRIRRRETDTGKASKAFPSSSTSNGGILLGKGRTPFFPKIMKGPGSSDGKQGSDAGSKETSSSSQGRFRGSVLSSSAGVAATTLLETPSPHSSSLQNTSITVPSRTHTPSSQTPSS